jgi:hypothetical protein
MPSLKAHDRVHGSRSALQIGFLRMTGRLLEAVRMVPPALWQHLGKQFDVAPPELASLRAMYRCEEFMRRSPRQRGTTLIIPFSASKSERLRV